MKEQWKYIIGYEGIYMVSNYGNVKSNADGRWKKLKNSLGSMGYMRVNLQGTVYRIHQLVARVFIANPENKPCINHKDLDKTNNHVSNLEWCTHKENNNHARDNGVVFKTKESIEKQRLKILGSNHPQSKLHETDVIYIKYLLNNTNLSTKEIAEPYNISRQTISDIKAGRHWGWL